MTATQDTPDLAAGIDASALVTDQPITGKVDGEDVLIVRHEGRLCAVSAKCTHLGAPLAKGLIKDGQIRCPWHHARFALESGEAIGAPAFKPLDRYEIEEKNSRVRVTGKADVASPPKFAAVDLGRVVIVGGGAAGHACADMLARAGAGASVLVLSADADEPYDRTFCSKHYLAGKKSRKDAAMVVPGQGHGPAPTIRTGVEVTRLHLDDGAVEVNRGEWVPFDTLVLATGAEPVLPDFEGWDREDVHVVRTLGDADRLIAAAEAAKAAVVVGSSYIALEVAAALVGRGLAVTVVAQGDVPLKKTAGSEVGAFVRRLHEDKGVTFHMGRTVRRWDGSTATLDDGSTVTGDFLVAGTGVKPRLALAEAAGLAMADKEAGGGIKVDETLRTSHPNVFAIGDIASVPDPRLGHPVRVEHWVVAQRMGQWLARHLLGTVSGGYGEVPFFWSAHYTTSLRYVGHVASPEHRDVDGDIAAKSVAVTFEEAGKPQALLTLGRDRQSLETEAAWDR